MADAVEVSALAINVAVPDELQWTDVRREVTFRLTTLNVRLLPDGRLATKAYGRPVDGGHGAYTSFAVPDRPELTELIGEAAKVEASRWQAAYAPEHDAH